MGNVWLSWMADDLEAAGLQVVRYAGWMTRARSSGGYSGNPLCVMWHHTASKTSPENDAYYMCHTSDSRPICNMLVARDGVVWVLAAGATNTNGKGKALEFSRGAVPKDSMNSWAVGMEIANNGVGEQYPQAQIDAAFRASNVINHRLGNQPSDVCTHQRYAPDRKIDPATCDVEGPWQPRSCTSSGSWDVTDLVDECLWRVGDEPSPPDPPEPPEVDMTDEQSSQLNDLWRALVLPMPGNTDPNGTEMGVNWTTVYGMRVGQDIQRRLWAIEDALGIPH